MQPVRLLLVIVAAMVCGSLTGSGIASASKSTPIHLEGDGLGVTSFGATTAVATKAITAVLGMSTGHPNDECVGAYSETSWHDLTLQFVSGRFRGYRYVIASYYWLGKVPPVTALSSATPKLSTPAGITIGDTLDETKHAYPTLRQSGTDFWRTASVNVPTIAFGIYNPSGHTAPTAQIYEIKNDACPPSL